MNIQGWATKPIFTSKTKVFVALFIVICATITSILTPKTVQADALDDKIELFLRYRWINACFSSDVGKRSPDEVVRGDFWTKWTDPDGDIKMPIGNGETKDCESEDDYIRETALKFGFQGAEQLFCSIQPNAGRERDGSGATDYEKCVNGTGYYDIKGSESDQQKQLRKGITDHASKGKDILTMPTDEMKYKMLYANFTRECKPEKTAHSSAPSGSGYVTTTLVEKTGAEATSTKVVYLIGAEDGTAHKVKDLWANLGNPSTYAEFSYTRTCGELASDMSKVAGAFERYLKTDSAATGPTNGSETAGDNTPVCQAGALGWVICPLISLGSEINDTAYSAVESMLEVKPYALKVDEPLYKVWVGFRDIANILFVIAFLVVIFSQATSFGLSSYGIKKMLPRIIAAAILVNLSFFICQIAIDLSNIVGSGMASFVAGFHSGSEVDINALSWSGLLTAILAGAAGYAGITVLLGTGGIVAAISLLLPFLVSALFAVITAIVVLVARQVLIILLVAIAPLAFVAMILPNTQKYFDTWRKTFTTLLVMYPLVALLFAGSKLAANITLTASTTEDGISVFAYIAAVSMLFLPLFGVPYVVKFSGGILGRVAGFVNNPNKGPFDSLRKKAEGYRDYKKDQGRLRANSGEFGGGRMGRIRKNTFGRYAQRQARRDATYANVKREADQATSNYVANKTVSDEDFARTMAGGKRYQGSNIDNAVRRVQAQGLAVERKESKERVAAIQELLVSKEEGKDSKAIMDMYHDTYKSAARSGDHETMSAILKQVSAKGAFGRQHASDMLTQNTIEGPDANTVNVARKAVERTVYEDLSLGGRADIVKGEMDMSTGRWKNKNISELSTELKASLDGNVLSQAIERTNRGEFDTVTKKRADGTEYTDTVAPVSQSEAQRIVTTNLIDRVENAAIVDQLRAIAGNTSTSAQATIPPGAAGGLSGNPVGPNELWVPRDNNTNRPRT